MTTVVSDSQRQDTIDLYVGGLSVQDVARRVGINPKTADKIISKAGVKRTRAQASRIVGDRLLGVERPEIRKPVPQEVLGLYEKGVSLRDIAAQFGKCRKDIARYLRANGIEPNPITTKIRKFGRDGLAVFALNASATVIGRRLTPEELHKRSKKKAETLTMVGIQEVDFCRELMRRGCHPIHQYPIGPYNLDIALEEERIAIEVQRGAWHGSTSAKPERIEYLFDRGWRVIYVLISRHGAPTDFAAICDKLVAFAQALRIDPAARGQYGVLRRDGESATRLPAHFNDRARIPSL